jgi:cystathionine beta-lyase family protein involved in aluminum resistance
MLLITELSKVSILFFFKFHLQKFSYIMILQLAEDGGLDWDCLMRALKPHTKCALIQRSCGYSWRQSLSVNEIGRAIKMIKV